MADGVWQDALRQLSMGVIIAAAPRGAQGAQAAQAARGAGKACH